MTEPDSEKSSMSEDPDCPFCNKKLPPPCPSCSSLKVSCNGKASGRQNYRCECGKQFVSDPARRRIHPRKWRTVDSLLGDDIEVAVIHRATGISKRHIYNRKSAAEQS